MFRLLALAVAVVGSAATVDEFYQVNEDYTSAYMDLLRELTTSGDQIDELKASLSATGEEIEAAEKNFQEQTTKLANLEAEQGRLPKKVQSLKQGRRRYSIGLENAKRKAVAEQLFASIEEIRPENFVAKKSGLNAKSARIQREIAQLEAEIAQLKSSGDYPKLNTKLVDAKTAVIKTEKLITSRKTQLPELKSQLNAVQNSLNVLRQQALATAKRRDRLHDVSIPQSQDRLAKLIEQVSQLKSQIFEFQKQIRAYQTVQNQNKLTVSQLSRQLKHRKKEKADLQIKIGDWKTDLAKLPHLKTEKEQLKKISIPAAEKNVKQSNASTAVAKTNLSKVKVLHRAAVNDANQKSQIFSKLSRDINTRQTKLSNWNREQANLNNSIKQAAKSEAEANKANAELDKVVAEILAKQELLETKKKRLKQIQGGSTPQQISLLKQRIASKDRQLVGVKKGLSSTNTEITQTQRQIDLACASERNQRVCERAKAKMITLIEQKKQSEATLAAIEKSKATLVQELTVATSGPDHSEERSQIENDISELTRDLNFARRDRQQLRIKVDSLNSKIAHLSGKRKRLAEIKSRVQIIESELSQLRSQFPIAKTDAEAATKTKQLMTRNLAKSGRELNNARAEQSKATRVLRNLRVELVKIDDRIIELETSGTEMNVAESQTLPKLQASIDQKTTALSGAKKILADSKAKEIELEQKRLSSQTELRKTEKRRSTATAQLSDLKLKLRSVISDVVKISESQSDYERQKSGLAAKISGGQLELSNAVRKLPLLKLRREDAETAIKVYGSAKIAPLENQVKSKMMATEALASDIKTYVDLEAMINGFDLRMTDFNDQIATLEKRVVSVASEIKQQRPLADLAQKNWDKIKGNDAKALAEIKVLTEKLDGVKDHFEELERLNDQTLKEVVR